MQETLKNPDGFIGNIEPKYGRWAWPYRQMNPGDWFTVKHLDREPGLIAQMTYVRANQLGKRFTVDKDFQPGVMKIECLPPHRGNGREEVILDSMDWNTFELLVRKYTDVEPNGTHADYMAPGAVSHWPCTYRTPLGKQRTFVYSVDDRYVLVEFKPTEMVLTRLSQPATASEFIEAEIAELMS